MLKRVAAIAIALLAVLLMVIATRPSHLHVERSLSVAAAPAVVFPLINSFAAWPSWSPWEKLDPDMKRQVSPIPNGKGATYAWAGNDQVRSEEHTSELQSLRHLVCRLLLEKKKKKKKL